MLFLCDLEQTGTKMWKSYSGEAPHGVCLCQKHAWGQMCGETVIHSEKRSYRDYLSDREMVYGQVNQVNRGREIIWISRREEHFVKT